MNINEVLYIAVSNSINNPHIAGELKLISFFKLFEFIKDNSKINLKTMESKIFNMYENYIMDIYKRDKDNLIEKLKKLENIHNIFFGENLNQSQFYTKMIEFIIDLNILDNNIFSEYIEEINYNNISYIAKLKLLTELIKNNREILLKLLKTKKLDPSLLDNENAGKYFESIYIKNSKKNSIYLFNKIQDELSNTVSLLKDVKVLQIFLDNGLNLNINTNVSKQLSLDMRKNIKLKEILKKELDDKLFNILEKDLTRKENLLVIDKITRNYNYYKQIINEPNFLDIRENNHNILFNTVKISNKNSVVFLNDLLDNNSNKDKIILFINEESNKKESFFEILSEVYLDNKNFSTLSIQSISFLIKNLRKLNSKDNHNFFYNQSYENKKIINNILKENYSYEEKCDIILGNNYKLIEDKVKKNIENLDLDSDYTLNQNLKDLVLYLEVYDLESFFTKNKYLSGSIYLLYSLLNNYFGFDYKIKIEEIKKTKPLLYDYNNIDVVAEELKELEKNFLFKDIDIKNKNNIKKRI